MSLSEGNGSNLQALIDASASGVLKADIVLVICNRLNGFGLQRAQNAGIPTVYLNLIPYSKKFPSSDASTKYGSEAREAYDSDLASKVLEVKPDMVVCAGFMHILSAAFLDPLAKEDIPILNLHPALPGMYDGVGAIERAFADFQDGKIKVTGIMIHYVIREVDRGAPIVTQEIEINSGDKLEDLERRIHEAEHRLIVQGVRKGLEERPEAR